MLGQSLTVGAFVIWGLAPLYFHYVDIDNIMHMMALRILWQCSIVLGVLKLTGFQFSQLKGISWRGLGFTALAGLALNVSWYGFIYALTNNLVLSSSLAYFICPLLVIAVSALCFSEPLVKTQKWAVGIMLLSLVWLLMNNAAELWLPMMIAVAFTSYYVLRKYSQLHGSRSIAVEHIAQLVLVPVIALAYPNWTVTSLADQQITAVCITIIQVMPVLLLTLSVNRVPLQQIGIIQYIEPTLHFALGYFVFKEHLNTDMLISMLGVWGAICIWMMPFIRRKRKPVFIN
ncbi:EamA family transporter [Vibrio alfacsensis]|uniref:EamA family transporter n=1 Tax=Vibrio TaxID=662 RepID=UPI0040676F2B